MFKCFYRKVTVMLSDLLALTYGYCFVFNISEVSPQVYIRGV